MKNIYRQVAMAVMVVLLTTACAGSPVQLGSPRSPGAAPTGAARTISAKACGFQLLLFIPIAINSRAGRAYQQLQTMASGDFITDVQVQESWTYGLVGTSYCTTLRAIAIRPR